jgi:hypothetical protein
MLIEDQRLVKLNLGTDTKSQILNISVQLKTCRVLEVEQMLKEFKDVFAWTYKDLKVIPLKLAQHIMEMDTTIPLAHKVKYILNPNYVIVVK